MTSATGEDLQGHQLRNVITVFVAETDLESSPQLAIPERIVGKLVPRLTPKQLFEFNFKQSVEVGFEGRAYRFSKLEKDVYSRSKFPAMIAARSVSTYTAVCSARSTHSGQASRCSSRGASSASSTTIPRW